MNRQTLDSTSPAPALRAPVFVNGYGLIGPLLAQGPRWSLILDDRGQVVPVPSAACEQLAS
jgi:hypothetical protein